MQEPNEPMDAAALLRLKRMQEDEEGAFFAQEDLDKLFELQNEKIEANEDALHDLRTDVKTFEQEQKDNLAEAERSFKRQLANETEDLQESIESLSSRVDDQDDEIRAAKRAFTETARHVQQVVQEVAELKVLFHRVIAKLRASRRSPDGAQAPGIEPNALALAQPEPTKP